MSAIGGLIGNPLATIVAAAVGGATGESLRPELQHLVNELWGLNQVKPPSAVILAEGVAQGQVDPDWARDRAAEQGFSADTFNRMVAIANVGPGSGFAFDLWRRGLIDAGGFGRALKRLGIEDEWIGPLRSLRDVRLSPAEVANAVQQGHLPNPGVLPNIDASIVFPAGYRQPGAPDDGGPSHVPLTQIDIPPGIEAEAHGVDFERLQVLANLSGLPPGPEALLHMWNRSLIDESSVDAGIREGHMKTKWAHAYKRMRWSVLSGPEYAELHLRDWITEAEMYEGGALTGHTPEQMRNLYRNRGRTATPRQVWLAWAREKTGPRGVPANFIDHEQAIRRSNIRPEYAEMLWEIRYNYPPLFQLNRLVQAGAITPATAAEWAKWNLYGPEVITAMTKYWESVYPGTATDSTTPDKARVNAAVTQAVTEIRSAYQVGQADGEQARGWLGRIGMNGATIDALLPIWDVMREVPQTDLTATQIKSAYRRMPAQWPRQRALDALILKGYTADDAATILDA